MKPAQGREVVMWVQDTYQAGVSRACRLSLILRALWCYRSRRPLQTALAMRIRELAHARPRFGARRVHVLLRREGWAVNHKRVRRLYRRNAAPMLNLPRTWT